MAEEQSFADSSEEGRSRQTGQHSGQIISSLVIAVLMLFIGLGIGYVIWGANAVTATVLPEVQPLGGGKTVVGNSLSQIASSAPSARPTYGPAPAPATLLVTLPQSYTLPISYGELGPKLVGAGAIDLPAFIQLFTESGDPLSPEQQAIVRDGSDTPVTIDRGNAHFLLNFFWAVGLANRNSLLTNGALQQYGDGNVEQFASTGGWTLAAKPIKELVGAVPLIDLTEVQQKRLEAVAGAVYRPCCGNSTLFPDCNHGMAMLGMLELMAANNASEEQMFTAAKYLNTFWFPQQMAEVAAYFKLAQNLDYAAIDPRRMVGRDVSSGTGFRSVHQWLANNGNLGTPTDSGASCAT